MERHKQTSIHHRERTEDQKKLIIQLGKPRLLTGELVRGYIHRNMENNSKSANSQDSAPQHKVLMMKTASFELSAWFAGNWTRSGCLPLLNSSYCLYRPMKDKSV